MAFGKTLGEEFTKAAGILAQKPMDGQATSEMPAMKRAAIYARVSTRNGHQDPETQLLALRQVAERAGSQVVEEYVDRGISGARGRDKRPAFDRLLKDATRRQFDLVMAWSVDRLGRSLQDLVAFLGEVHAQGVDLYLDRQGPIQPRPAVRRCFR
jgi:predicted site-specific integrase-resolvase